MATGTRRRRTKEQIVTRDRYFIEVVGGARREAKFHLAITALTEAQTAALNAEEEVELRVIRQPLLGQEHVAYRVVRDEDGAVLTYTEED